VGSEKLKVVHREPTGGSPDSGGWARGFAVKPLGRTRGVTEIRAKGQRDDLEALSAGPVPYFRGTAVLVCQRQNTGRTGLDDHYSPVA
jgi:hypothetical protein